jgi:hypothetical protein
MRTSNGVGGTPECLPKEMLVAQVEALGKGCRVKGWFICVLALRQTRLGMRWQDEARSTGRR